MKSIEIEGYSSEESQQSVKETDNKDYFRREEIIGTPFTMIWEDTKGWYLTIGKYRVSDPVEDKIDLLQMVEEKSWDFLITVIGIVVEQYKNVDKNGTN